MEVKIPFNDWSKERLKQGIKTATTRNKKYGNVGDTFTVDNIQYVLIAINFVRLGLVAKVAYDVEGAKSKKEFVDIWKQIHPRKGFDSEQKVWYHRFKKEV